MTHKADEPQMTGEEMVRIGDEAQIETVARRLSMGTNEVKRLVGKLVRDRLNWLLLQNLYYKELKRHMKSQDRKMLK